MNETLVEIALSVKSVYESLYEFENDNPDDFESVDQKLVWLIQSSKHLRELVEKQPVLDQLFLDGLNEAVSELPNERYEYYMSDVYFHCPEELLELTEWADHKTLSVVVDAD